MSGVTHRMGVFKELAQALAATPDEDARVALAVKAARSLVERCSYAGFTVNECGVLSTHQSSDDVVRKANELQQTVGEGPCLDVARDQDTLVSANLAAEPRWPLWAFRVHSDLEVSSMISVLVHAADHSFGALSLYSVRGVRFDVDDVAIAQNLAVQVAMSFTSVREVHQLGRALHSRTIIGQATGLVMARFSIDGDQAFDYLRRLSSHSNCKVVDICYEIVRTGNVPDDE